MDVIGSTTNNEPLEEIKIYENSTYILIFKNENQNEINLLNYSQYINETGLLINDIFVNVTNTSKYNNLHIEGM